MLEKIQQKIDKHKVYEVLEREAGNQAVSNLIGEFMGDLNILLEFAKEKKKECCAKKAGKQVVVTCCRDCPYLVKNDFVDDFCGHFKVKIPFEIACYDIIPDRCPL